MSSPKISVEVICPYCHTVLKLTKKVERTQKTITCPLDGCGKKLNIVFDVTTDPQSYQIVTESQEPQQPKAKKTIYKKTRYGHGNQSGENQSSEHNHSDYGDEYDRKKTPHKPNVDFEEDEPEYVTPKKRHRLRERIFLTHITWFGLRNQRYQLHEGTTIIGRYDEDDTSDIMIKGDETMSRRSVAIIIEEEQGIFDYKMKVLNATNKVKVNDQPIKVGDEVYLDMGDIIMLGNSKFKFDNH